MSEQSMGPYRTISASTNDPPRLFALAPFEGPACHCPACGSGLTLGPICAGLRSFWRRVALCPTSHLHFHPKCFRCGYTWLMATKLASDEAAR